MKTVVQLIFILVCAQGVSLGCGLLEKLQDEITGNTAAEGTDSGTQEAADHKVATDSSTPTGQGAETAAVAVSASVPEAPSLSVEGVPDLDVTVGNELSDVDRDLSQQYNNDAVQYYKKNDYDTAESLFLKALKKNPSNLVFRYNLACIAALKNNKNKALALLRQLKETPTCPRCYILLAKAVEDPDFTSIRSDETFASLVDGAPERLAAELKLSKYIQFDGKNSQLPIRTNGLPAITDDGKRIAVVNYFKNGYRMQIILVSSGEVVNNVVLLNAKEIEQLKNNEVDARDMRPRIKQRIDKAHKVLLGRTWLEFTVKSNSIAPTWLRGSAQQRFQLGNSTVTYRYPNLTITNSKGRESFKGKIGDFPDDDCTTIAAISEAYVNGQFHVMLFRQHNATLNRCTPQPGKYHVVNLAE